MNANQLGDFINQSELLEIYEELERDILVYLAGRASATEKILTATAYQAQVRKEVVAAQKYIAGLINASEKKQQAEIISMLSFVSKDKIDEVNAIAAKASLEALELGKNAALKATLEQQAKLVIKTMANLTATTAKNAGGQLYSVLSKASNQVTSGAFTYQTAITNAIKSLANSGVTAINYTGGPTVSLYTGARRAVLTSMNQTAQKVADTAMDEHGIDLVEVNAHVGAREEHAGWQGKIYSRSGKNKKYPDLVTSTGYGSVTGLAGANCRHSYLPYIEGLSKASYSSETVEAMNAETVTYNGAKISVEKALQQQRYMERQVRSWKNESAMFTAAGNESAATKAKAKVSSWQGKLNSFTKETGLKRDYTREQ